MFIRSHVTNMHYGVTTIPRAVIPTPLLKIDLTNRTSPNTSQHVITENLDVMHNGVTNSLTPGEKNCPQNTYKKWKHGRG